MTTRLMFVLLCLFVLFDLTRYLVKKHGVRFITCKNDSFPCYSLSLARESTSSCTRHNRWGNITGNTGIVLVFQQKFLLFPCAYTASFLASLHSFFPCLESITWNVMTIHVEGNVAENCFVQEVQLQSLYSKKEQTTHFFAKRSLDFNAISFGSLPLENPVKLFSYTRDLQFYLKTMERMTQNSHVS